MYRECDLVSDFEANPIRATIPENQAKFGNLVKVTGYSNNWQIIRVHGYSVVDLPVKILPVNFAKKTLTEISS